MPKNPQVADDVTVRIGRSRPMGVNEGTSHAPAPPPPPSVPKDTLTPGRNVAAPGSAAVASGSAGSPVAPTPGLTLNGVSAAEAALAASSGTLPAQIAARKKVAKAFYDQQTGWSAARIKQHLMGIDFTKPVKARLTPPPSTGIQWQAPGQPQGNYYAQPGSTPSELGVGNLGLTPGPRPQQITAKVPLPYNVTSGTPVLESTAAKITDTWSVPANAGTPGTIGNLGIKQVTKGGGTQYFIADKTAAKP